MKLSLFSFFLLFVFLVSLVLSGCAKGPGEYDALAQCLTEKGAKMYGTEWCSHCKSQKKAFGNSFQYIDYIDCDFNKNECRQAGIEGYPTWVIDGLKYLGEQSLERLASVTGC